MSSDQPTEFVKALLERTLTGANYKIHPAVFKLSSPYPEMAHVNALQKDIRVNGLKVKILRSRDGTIIDGLARLLAMLLEGIKPKDTDFVTIDDDTTAGIMLRRMQLNLSRGHYTQGQIAMMTVCMKQEGVPIYNDDYKKLGTSEESVARAARVVKSGNKAVIEAVQSGAMAVSHADKVISGRVPVSEAGPAAMACAAPVDEAVHAEAEPKTRGRQPGNVKVNAVKRGIAELAKAVDHADEIKTYWRPDSEEVEEIKECRKLLGDLLPKPPRKTAPSTEQAAEDNPTAVH